ncbi:MAG TPA: hypothetical protein VKA68_18990, partial [bacterium]|nr:hypothetical protein [bacterium]
MRKVFLLFVLCFSLILIWDSADGQIKRRLYVGRLNWDQDTQGASWMSSVTSEGEDSPSIWYNWQPWPDLATDIGYHGIDVNGSAHLSNIHGKNLVGQKAYWVGASNWTAPAADLWGVGPSGVYEPGTTYPVFVNDNGPVTLNSLINTPHEEFTPPASFRRVSMPTVLIDGAEQTPVGFPVNELSGFEVDPSLVDIRADGVVEGKWTDPIGVTFHQRQFAWTHPNYDAIILLEVTIKNTGDVNADIDGIEKPGQTLNNFWLGIKHYLGPPEGDWLDFGSFPEYNGQADNLLDYDPATRYFWSWDGDANDVQGDDQFDPRGGPIGTGETENPTGEFLSPDVTGYAILYVDGPDDDTDHDAGQPATFRYKEFRNMLSPVQGTGTMQEAYNWMSGNDLDPMYQTGHSGNPFQPLGTARPHYDPVLGVGPYTLAPDESLKV